MTSQPLRPGLALRHTGLAGTPIFYDSPQRRPAPQLQARDLEIMRALWRYTFLSTSQIGETWWADNHPSRPQIRLSELAAAGLLLRFRPLVKRGTHQWIYQLARHGFRAAQSSYGPEGTYIHETERWSERRAGDMQRVEQILRVNGWMLAYRFAVGARLLDWLGPREARTTRRDEAKQDDVAVSPDAAALLDLDPGSPALELLVELDRDERPVRLTERLRRYDDLLTESWRSVPRLQGAGQAPAVLFIAEGYRQVDRLLRAADPVITARSKLLFCAEPDLHRGDPRAWTLPPKTPDQRDSEDFTAIQVALPT